TGNKIGRITTAGVITNEFTVPTAGSGPTGITLGPDGALWFTEQFGDQVGRITTAGTFTEFGAASGITAGSAPLTITTGPDAALWFTGSLGNRIARLLPLQIQASPAQFPVGLGAGASGVVPVVNLSTGQPTASNVNPFPGFSGEVRRAA